MQYPVPIKLSAKNIFTNEICFTLYSGLTFFIGANGTGKTQTLKSLRDYFRNNHKTEKVRYLSSNRLGIMEQYRSRVNQYGYSPNDYTFGDIETKTHRLLIETATGDFFTMDEKKDVYIKVAERLSVLFHRQIFLRWDSGNMKAYFERTNENKEYPVVSEASGLVNVISILAALFDEEIDILLIDEPEVSLHPQIQSYLLKEIKKASNSGKTIIISTHSSEILSLSHASDFCNFIFFEEDAPPIQIKPEAEELKNTKLQALLVRMGQTYRNAFFAKRILLIEGASDLIICRTIEGKLDLNIDIAGSYIIPIEGKGQFPIVTKLFHMINKEVAILTDLDGFIDDGNIVQLFTMLPQAYEIAHKNGMDNLNDIIKSVKTDAFNLIEKHIDDMRIIYSNHPYYKCQTENNTKSIRRAMVGQLLSSDIADIEKWTNPTEWIGLRERLESIFSQLEKLGCFILKRGALESYYKVADNNTYTDKPSEAIKEVIHIESQATPYIREHYADIVKALEYISLSKKIDESFAVKKELLSELPLALEILINNPSSDESEIYAAIKQSRNIKESIFNYSKVKNEDSIKLHVDIKSKILDVSGFPFEISIDENVNKFVDAHIKMHN